MRKRFYYICCALCLTLINSSLLFCQETVSKTVKYHLRHLVEVDSEELNDTDPPELIFLSPEIKFGQDYISDSEELTLVGEANDQSKVRVVTIDSNIAQLDGSGVFTSKIVLKKGKNLVRVMAIDDYNNKVEKYYSIDYQPPIVTLADRINSEARYFALIIGIDRYKDGRLPDLESPIKDATRLADILIKRYTFQKENMKLLKNPTRGEIIESFDELDRQLTRNDNLLIYYAGHGWWDEEANIGYWLPSDADNNIKTNWFRNSTLVDYLKDINTKHTLLITDACFGGSIFNSRSAFPVEERAFEKLYDLPSRKAMTSGRYETVPDRSSFSKFLMERLDENEKAYLSSEQLFSSFRIAVINNSDAIPQYGEIRSVGDQGGDFIFLLKQD